MTTQALTVRDGRLPMQTFDELTRAGQLLAQSNMFGINNAAAGFVVAATCHQQGMSLMEFGRTYHIIDGRPSMRADAMLAEFRKAGGKCRLIENSTTKAEAEFEFEGQKCKFSYTMDDARRTGDCFKSDGKTLKHNWERRADDMLWARMVSRAVRRMAPEINAGLYPPEEVGDMPATPPAPPTPISPEEAVRRAKTVEAEVAPATAQPEAAAPVTVISDATVCPDGFGEYSGHPWAEMDTETLQGALESDGLRPGHKAAIRLVLEERKGKES